VLPSHNAKNIHANVDDLPLIVDVPSFKFASVKNIKPETQLKNTDNRKKKVTDFKLLKINSHIHIKKNFWMKMKELKIQIISIRSILIIS